MMHRHLLPNSTCVSADIFNHGTDHPAVCFNKMDQRDHQLQGHNVEYPGEHSDGYRTINSAFDISTAEGHLDVAADCMKRVQRLPQQQVYVLLCQYLKVKLTKTVQQAQECLNPDRPHRRERVNASHLGCFQLLSRLAKEVLNFVDLYTKEDEWIRSLFMRTTPTEHVYMLGFDLDICRAVMCQSILRNESGATMRTMTVVSSRRRSEFDMIRQHALLDQKKMVEKLKGVLERLKQSSRENVPDLKNLRERAAFALRKVEAAGHGSAAGPAALSLLEVDFDSLKSLSKHGHLATTESSSVDRVTYHGDLFVQKTFYTGPFDPTYVSEKSINGGIPPHPNVVPVACFAENERDGGSLVMESMECDLFDLMLTKMQRHESLKAPFSFPEKFDIMLQVSLGVEHLHRNHIVHFDLKSRNILVNTEGDNIRVKVGDLGSSKLNVGSILLSQVLRIGTTRWMDPDLLKQPNPQAAPNQVSTAPSHTEVVERPALTDPFKCDIYSLGMVLYEILTGHIPFYDVQTIKETKRMVLDGHRPVLPDDCPRRLSNLIKRCWQADASSRPSIAEICTELLYLRCALMTGDGDDNCEPIDPALAASLFERPTPFDDHTLELSSDEAGFLSSPAATELQRVFTSGAGTSSPADAAIPLSPQYAGACTVEMALECTEHPSAKVCELSHHRISLRTPDAGHVLIDGQMPGF